MTTNRVGLTPEQSANTFTDEQLESLVYGNNPQSNVYRELLAYRKASKEPVATQFKQVADLYEMQFDDGRTCAFHTDAGKAVQWLITCDGNKVQEYVKLERLRNALTDTQAVTVPDGWKLVPIEPTYEMSKAIGLPWEQPPFPLRWKRMLEAAPKAGGNG